MSAPLPSEVVSRASSPSIDEVRPRTYGDCLTRDLGGEGSPCPWVGCKHHLAVDVDPRSGELSLHAPDASGEDVDWDAILRSGVPTCSLRAAGVDEVTLVQVGEALGVTRERVRQIEAVALAKLRGRAERLHLVELIDDEVDADDARRSRLEARGGVGAVRPTEDRAPLPPPAHLAHLPGPEGVTGAGMHFWCGVIGTELTGALCARRHRARMPQVGALVSLRGGTPLYPECARCPAGAAVAVRLGDVEEPAAARRARVALRVIESRRGVAATAPTLAPLVQLAPSPADHDEVVVRGGDAEAEEDPRADEVEPAAEVIVAKGTCDARGCKSAPAGEQSNTRPWARGLCAEHREKVRWLSDKRGRFAGNPEAARAELTGGAPLRRSGESIGTTASRGSADACLAPGCTELAAGERTDTPSWAKGLCLRCRKTVRERGARLSDPNKARALLLGGEVIPRASVKVTRRSAPTPKVTATTEPPATAVSSPIESPKPTPSPRVESASAFDGISLAVEGDTLVVRVPLAALPQVGAALELVARAGGVERVERLVAAAEAFAKVAG